MPPSPRQESEAGPSRRRISKACENCRIRRTKCSGDTPCQACRANALESSCVVRDKARPNRLALSARRRRPSTYSKPDDSPPPDIPRVPRINAMAEIEARASRWLIRKGLPPSSLLFNDEDRMARIAATPLPTNPTELIAFEDELMRHLILSHEIEQSAKVGRTQFISLYNQYRAAGAASASAAMAGGPRGGPEGGLGQGSGAGPGAGASVGTDGVGDIPDDARAVVYAVLCLAKHTKMRSYVASGIPTVDSQTREDVTYFRMACACLASVTTPSLHAVLTLLCLVPYAQGHGGMGESRSLLRMMAWHIREIGLHKQEVVDQFPAGDVDPAIFPMFRYMDTFMAGLTDLQPSFSNAECDVSLLIPAHVMPACQQTASMFAAVFHDDLADPTLDVRSDGYVNVSESSWAPALADVRRGTTTGEVTRVRLAWAEVRYHWLRILLYASRIDADTSRSAHAMILLLHSTSSTIHIYTELIAIGHLNPSWPQLRRLATLSQLLVLCTEDGVLLPGPAADLFDKLVRLLEMHRPTWPAATAALEEGVRRASLALGLSVHIASPSAFDLPMLDQRMQAEIFGTFPFDPMSLFTAGVWDDEALLHGVDSGGPSEADGQGMLMPPS